MAKLRVHGFSVSLDGYGAGPNQDLDNPLGVGGRALHEWAFATRTFQQMHGGDGGSTGTDDEFAARGFRNIGAWILGRNMFGPVRGPWPDENWKGWWGDDPPYHSPVFVLTNHPRASQPTAKTSGLAAGLRRSGNIFAPDLSTRCIWQFHPSSSVSGSTFSPASTHRSSATNAPNTSQLRTPHTSSSPSATKNWDVGAALVRCHREPDN